MPRAASHNEKTTIVVADVDSAVRRLLAQRLEADGFSVVQAEAVDLPMVHRVRATGVVATIGNQLPSSRLNELAAAATIIALLPVGASEVDELDALDAGADAVVVKPFSPREVGAKLRAALRRVVELDERRGVLSFDGLEIDEARREVRVRGAVVKMPAREFDLLLYLARSPRQVFSRTQLMRQVWETEADIASATITEHVRRLRSRIEDDPRAPRWVVTVRSVGYRFEP